MSASLVGSEMCIRDRSLRSLQSSSRASRPRTTRKAMRALRTPRAVVADRPAQALHEEWRRMHPSGAEAGEFAAPVSGAPNAPSGPPAL
eukprot:9914329-Alexandrium_andersonii.AAC.1